MRHAGLHRLLDARARLRQVEGDGVVQRRLEVGADLVQAPGLVGPQQRASGEIEFPAADAGGAPGALQERLAGAQRAFGALAGADVASHRVQQWPAVGVGLRDQLALRIEHRAVAPLADGQRLLVQAAHGQRLVDERAAHPQRLHCHPGQVLQQRRRCWRSMTHSVPTRAPSASTSGAPA